MLKNAKVATRLPAKDLNRARAFYSEKLGLEPIEQREGGLRYVCGAGEFAIFVSTGLQSGTHTQMGWEVDDIVATVRELRARGIEFEEYDLPSLRTVDGIAEIGGNYPSKGNCERGAGEAAARGARACSVAYSHGATANEYCPSSSAVARHFSDFVRCCRWMCGRPPSIHPHGGNRK